jgi:ATP-dependent helicase/nuclease subunit A
MSDPQPAPFLTPQQHLAVHTRDASVVLSSGAGCGKTHVLTQRYLAHLREGAEVAGVLAITFTDRAARQMRGRIRQAVAAHLRDAPEPQAEAWARRLRALQSAPVCTIHAFCGNLLRQYAVEAGLDPRFEVLEEVLAANLRAEALSACLQQLLVAETPAGDDLKELVLLYGWRVAVEAVEALLHDHDERAWRAWLAHSPQDTADAWLRHAQRTVGPAQLAHFVRTRPAVTRCLDLLRRHPPLPGPMSEPVAILLAETPLLPQAGDLAAAVARLTGAAKVGRVGAKAWPDPAVYEAVKKAFEDYREALRSLEPEAADADALLGCVETGRRFVRVASEAACAYRERKRQLGVVDFQDLLLLAQDLLTNRPEVQAALQDRYRHVLIDELQDTDPVQVGLVEALCGGGLSTGKLFAVGDHKQSIYRFRGADVSLFLDLRRRMPAGGRQGLTVNFRSQPAVLDFANALLGQALEDYEPLVPHQRQLTPGPCVEFLWGPRAEKATAAEGRAAEAEWLARRIAGMVGREALVVDGARGAPRPVRAGDVVLLFRAMSHVHLYETALRRQGLNYYLVGGRAFFAQQEIYDILNLLRALENPQDSLSLAGALRSPLCGLSDEALYALGRHRQGLWAGLFDPHTETLLPGGQLETVRRARRFWQGWRGAKDRLGIAGLLAAVWADSGYDAALQLEPLGDRKLANLWKLTELARTFDRSGLFGLPEFIARLGDLVAAAPREEQAATQPENADVVRLMSIHQAKGLEFPVVFLPDFASPGGSSFPPVAAWSPAMGCVARPPADEDPPPFPAFAWRTLQAGDEVAEWAEDLRTLYVACTRPRDYLVLSAALPPDYQPAGPWMHTLAGRFDLSSGACLAADVPPERRPAVRVFDAGRPPPAPPAPPAPPVAPAAPPPPPAALSVARGNEPVAFGELRHWLDQAGTLFTGVGPAGEEPPREDKRLRAVLRRWDFRRADGWREPLDRHVAQPGERARLEAALQAFATTPLRERLGQARAVRREVEYLTGAAEDAPGVFGSIDCLWQDEGGRWNLLWWVTAPVPPSAQEGHFRRRETELALAAAAVRAQTGEWPRGVALVFLGGGVVERVASRLSHRGVLAEAARALREIAASPVAPAV